MKQKPKPTSKPQAKAKKKPTGDQAMLERHQKHRDKAEYHRAQADLIEAKLKAQGKEIRHVYPGESAPSQRPAPKPVIAPRRNLY